MAVFTPVTIDTLRVWLRHFSLGYLQAVHPIATGIENSNFFLHFAGQPASLVLTIFEKLDAEVLPFYLGLMQHLAQAGLPVPCPVANKQGDVLHRLENKPAALVTRLAGTSIQHPDNAHCHQVGNFLAEMHLAARNFPLQQENPCGLSWQIKTAAQLLPQLCAKQQAFLQKEIDFQQILVNSPAFHAVLNAKYFGPIHGDLFRDNVLFIAQATAPQLSGVLDFYFAGCDIWLLDLAIVANDWCVDATGHFDALRLHALVNAYHAKRPLCAEECFLWPGILRSAALRFWLSRLFDQHYPRKAAMLTPHNPAYFEQVLQLRHTETTLSTISCHG